MARDNATLPTDETFQLADGRTLGYAEYGVLTGTPVLYFHGFPASRLEAAAWASAATQTGARLIALDRPGMGLSTFKAGRQFTDWPTDVVALADHLSLKRFALLGVSGGAPYALACAAKIPDRVSVCGIVSGIGPLELGTAGMLPTSRLIFFLARWFPGLLKPVLWSATGKPSQDGAAFETLLLKSAKSLPAPDRDCLLTTDLKSYLAASTAEAFRQGADGAAYEGKLYGHAWDFRLQDIAFSPLYLWHGTLDRNAPIGMARGVASRLSGCQATFYPNESHLSTPFNHADEIMRTLITAVAQTDA